MKKLIADPKDTWTYYTVKRLRETSYSGSKLEIICGLCDGRSSLDLKQYVSKKYKPQKQLHQIFKCWQCPVCNGNPDFKNILLDDITIVYRASFTAHMPLMMDVEIASDYL